MDAKRRARLRQHAEPQSVAKQGRAPRFWLESSALSMRMRDACDPHEILHAAQGIHQE